MTRHVWRIQRKGQDMIGSTRRRTVARMAHLWLLLAVGSCARRPPVSTMNDSGTRPPATKQTAETAPRTSIEKAPTPAFRIVAAKGITGLRLGDSATKAGEVLGMREMQTGPFGDIYLVFRSKGVELLMRGKMIFTMFLHYRSKDHSPFDGVTDKGVGSSTTIAEVIAKHGAPAATNESSVSDQNGAPTGSTEKSLEYRGIVFTFRDDQLKDIRVVTPNDTISGLHAYLAGRDPALTYAHLRKNADGYLGKVMWFRGRIQTIFESEGKTQILGGQVKSGQSWTGQNRPVVAAVGTGFLTSQRHLIASQLAAWCASFEGRT